MNITVNIPDEMYERLNRQIADDLDSSASNVEEAISGFLDAVDAYNAVPMDLDNMVRFEDARFERYPMSKVNPRKRADVACILDHVPEWASEVWLLGSAITTHCHEGSDLDVVFVSKDFKDDINDVIRLCDWRKTLPYRFRSDMQVVSKEILDSNNDFMITVREKGLRII